MYLYLVQHAESKPKEEDSERGLTDQGWVDVKKMADFADRLADIRLKRILHSGKTRAAQTAEVFEDYLQPREGVEAVEGLGPMDDPSVMAERLKEMTDDVMLVGHLPHLAKLTSLLLSGDELGNVVTFRNAGIVCLSRSEDIWSLVWAVTPEVLG